MTSAVAEEALILVCARAPKNLELLSGVLTDAGYGVTVAGTVDELDEALGAAKSPDAAFVDMSGLGRDAKPRLERMKAHGPPFVVILPGRLGSAVPQALASGARTALVKPVRVADIVRWAAALT